MRGVLVAVALFTAMLSGCAGSEGSEDVDSDGDGFTDAEEERRGSDPADPGSTPVTVAVSAGDDAVVIAVVDSGINPYHFDYRADLMPQHRNSDPSDDLPLDTDPANWLRGHPGGAHFGSYGPLRLTLSDDQDASGQDLYDGDGDQWSDMESSSGEEDDGVHVRWIPGTKIVGLVSFSGDGFSAGSHGGGSASVSAGALHGACPQCLLVFVNGLGHQANEWVAKQDWIDAQTNSWGYSATGVARDRIHTGCDLADQRTAVERGQQMFFSAGNGLNNAFTVPNPTLFSCQEGPDWIVTVGAINPADGSSYHHGHPTDVASVGGGYPSASCSATINCTGNFGGTSNATPVTAGMYGRALYELRAMMEGPSRTQSNGTISLGAAECVEAGCMLEDGSLSGHELRQALYAGSEWQAVGRSVIAGPSAPVMTDETVWAAEGHGSFWGRLQGDAQYEEEVDRIVGAVTGGFTRDFPGEARLWFESLSYCTQEAWGAWDHGDYQGSLDLPSPAHPVTLWLQTGCPETVKAVVDNV